MPFSSQLADAALYRVADAALYCAAGVTINEYPIGVCSPSVHLMGHKCAGYFRGCFEQTVSLLVIDE